MLNLYNIIIGLCNSYYLKGEQLYCVLYFTIKGNIHGYCQVGDILGLVALCS